MSHFVRHLCEWRFGGQGALARRVLEATCSKVMRVSTIYFCLDHMGVLVAIILVMNNIPGEGGGGGGNK